MQEGEEVRQKNEGKWSFGLQDSIDGSAVELDVEIGRYMDTSLVRADVQPFFVRLLIKVRACLRISQNITCCFGLLSNISSQRYPAGFLRCLQASPFSRLYGSYTLRKRLVVPMAAFLICLGA